MASTDRSSASASSSGRERATSGGGSGEPRRGTAPEPGPHGLDPLAGVAAIRDQVEVLRDDAARLADLGRAARTGLEWSLRERLDRNPYAVLASAAGIGAILGGALTPTMVLAVASGAIRLSAATALRGALVQALQSGLGQTLGGAGPAHDGNHQPHSETKS